MTLDLHDIEAIAERVAQKLKAFNAAVAATPKAPEVELVGVPEAMRMLGCNSVRTLNRTLTDLKIKAIRRGKWRGKDLVNAVARKSLTASK